MDMIISMNNNEKIFVLPICPLPEITDSVTNEVVDTINGPINLFGNRNLKTINFDSIFLNNKYDWIRPGAISNAQVYIDFFNEIMNRKIPARLIWVGKDGPKLNIAVTLESFNYIEDRAGDVQYAVEFLEYRFL